MDAYEQSIQEKYNYTLYEVMHVSDEYACVCAPDYVHVYVCLLSDSQTASLSDRGT